MDRFAILSLYEGENMDKNKILLNALEEQIRIKEMEIDVLKEEINKLIS